MAMASVKEQILNAVQNFPDDVSYDEVLEYMYLLQKVNSGLEDAANGNVTSHEQVKSRFEK